MEAETLAYMQYRARQIAKGRGSSFFFDSSGGYCRDHFAGCNREPGRCDCHVHTWTLRSETLGAAAGIILISRTGNNFAGLWYPMIIAAICAVVCYVAVPETSHVDIESQTRSPQSVTVTGHPLTHPISTPNRPNHGGGAAVSASMVSIAWHYWLSRFWRGKWANLAGVFPSRPSCPLCLKRVIPLKTVEPHYSTYHLSGNVT